MSLHRICCIDDDIDNLNMLNEILADKYEVFLVDAPEVAIERLNNIQPHVILLDVNISRINGYSLCKKIRDSELIGSTPVIFVSCMKELKDRLAGYECGGDGYITKPFDTRELRLIVHSHVTRKLQYEATKSSLKQLETMQWSMLKNSSEMSELLKFSRGISRVKDEAAFVDHIFSTLTNFGLKATLLVKLVSGEIVARNDGKPFTLIEKELLDMAQCGPKITAHGTKYIFKGSNLVLLIKNMPIEDSELVGRLRDHLCILLDSAEASIEIINGERLRRHNDESKTKATLGTVQDEFDKMTSLAERLYKQSTSSVEKLSRELENAFMFMNLTEEQEHQILAFIDAARKDGGNQFNLKNQFRESMDHILETI